MSSTNSGSGLIRVLLAIAVVGPLCFFVGSNISPKADGATKKSNSETIFEEFRRKEAELHSDYLLRRGELLKLFQSGLQAEALEREELRRRQERMDIPSYAGHLPPGADKPSEAPEATPPSGDK